LIRIENCTCNIFTNVTQKISRLLELERLTNFHEEEEGN